MIQRYYFYPKGVQKAVDVVDLQQIYIQGLSQVYEKMYFLAV
jgi:hypothetical protein